MAEILKKLRKGDFKKSCANPMDLGLEFFFGILVLFDDEMFF